jgi:immune inhibitor A
VQQDNNNNWRILIIALFACLCLCGAALVCAAAATVYYGDNGENPFPLITLVPPTSGPSPTPVVVMRTPVPTSAVETANAVINTNVPQADPRALAERLKRIANIPEVVRDTPPVYNVGDEETFWVSNSETNENFQITAVLRAATPHLYMWVEKGQRVNQGNLEAAAQLFEDSTYVKDREFFGSEWTPGVDSDPHLYVLHARNMGNSTGGYFASVDEYSHLVHEHSNEHEMFYINLDGACDSCVSPVNSDYYNGTLAHEFQHMIHWYHDPNEESWMNEGSSVLAEFLNGFFSTGGVDDEFLRTPDTQLNDWAEGGAGVNTEHYGSGFLFMLYFLDRFGDQTTRALISNQENGIAAVDATLKDQNLSFEQVYGDWVAANYLDDPSIDDGRFGYNNYDPPRAVTLDKRYDTGQLNTGIGPVSSSVHQYGTDYIRIRGNKPVTFSFAGSTSVKLMDTDAHSGRYLWWSNRADDSDTTLTRPIDLSAVSSAKLQFWTWYDLEEDWDYAYVEVSTDDGTTWDILRSNSSVDTNPNGNSFGWGFTGRSGGGEQAGWVQEEIDLSAYAGKQALLRFEMITDAAVNRPGLALDDIRIDAIGLSDDAETLDPAWDAQGWIRHDNTLPEGFLVQAIEKSSNGTTVRRLDLQPDQTGEWTLDLGGTVTEVVITISGLAPKTTELATYEYSIK